MERLRAAFIGVVAVAAFAGVAAGAAPQSVPRGFTIVQPVQRPAATGASASAPQLTVSATPYFSYAMPAGWSIGESGQYALTLIAPDRKAVTLLVGNSGLPVSFPPAQFAYQKLMGLQPQNLQLGQPRQARPLQGFMQAWEYPVRYSVGGVPCEGVATVHIATTYDFAVMAVTAALSESRQWQGYSRWLPLVAGLVSARNGAAFGLRGVMTQNLQNSIEYGRALQEYRDWSQKNWQGVTDQRNASQDRNNQQFREALGNVQAYVDPRDATRPPIELPNTYQYYWQNEKGVIVGTNDGTINPNAGSTRDWRPMPKRDR